MQISELINQAKVAARKIADDAIKRDELFPEDGSQGNLDVITVELTRELIQCGATNEEILAAWSAITEEHCNRYNALSDASLTHGGSA